MPCDDQGMAHRFGLGFAAAFGIGTTALGGLCISAAFILEPPSSPALSVIVDIVWIGVGLLLVLGGVGLLRSAASDLRAR